MRSPWNESTRRRQPLHSTSFSASSSISRRSSTVKSAPRFSGLTKTAMMISSKSFEPRSMMSRWPFVTGSKEPG
jgi:hypothetical protein